MHRRSWTTDCHRVPGLSAISPHGGTLFTGSYVFLGKMCFTWQNQLYLNKCFTSKNTSYFFRTQWTCQRWPPSSGVTLMRKEITQSSLLNTCGWGGNIYLIGIHKKMLYQHCRGATNNDFFGSTPIEPKEKTYTWAGVGEALTMALKMEKDVTGRMKDMIDTCSTAGSDDPHAADWLTGWFCIPFVLVSLWISPWSSFHIFLFVPRISQQNHRRYLSVLLISFLYLKAMHQYGFW